MSAHDQSGFWSSISRLYGGSSQSFVFEVGQELSVEIQRPSLLQPHCFHTQMTYEQVLGRPPYRHRAR